MLKGRDVPVTCELVATVGVSCDNWASAAVGMSHDMEVHEGV